jgi:hypothetical protein
MCDCNSFTDLKLHSDELKIREKLFKQLSGKLDKIAEATNKIHTLYQCPECQQLWQSSWLTYDRTLLFKTPSIAVEEWKEEAFVSPSELVQFSHYMSMYLNRLPTIRFKNEKCRNETCTNRAIANSVFCLRHHITSQSVQLMPKFPKGRWFAPYVYEDFEISDKNLERFFINHSVANKSLAPGDLSKKCPD